MCVPDFLTRTVYFSELDGLQMYMGRGQQKLKNMFSGFLTRTVFCSELDRTNIRLGSKNRKSLSSGLLTRTVYFSECERDTYTVRVKKQEQCVSGFLTRTAYFSELELAEIYGAGHKHRKTKSSGKFFVCDVRLFAQAEPSSRALTSLTIKS